MKQPLGFEVEGQENKVCLLKRSLYGLKQSPRKRYLRFDEYMTSHGFKRIRYDNCVYLKEYLKGEFVYLLLYVDDMLVACKFKDEIAATKSMLKREFDMKEMGNAKKILGTEINKVIRLKQLKLTQNKYLEMILHNFSMEGSKPVMTPMAQHFNLSSLNSPNS